MQVGVEPLCLYFQEIRRLPLPVHTLCFLLQAVEVGGRQLTQEMMLCLPPLGVPAVGQLLWQREVVEEERMVVLEVHPEQQGTQTLGMITVGRQVVVDTWPMEAVSMVEGLGSTTMQPQVGSRLLAAIQALGGTRLLWELWDAVDSVAAARETMLEEVAEGTVVGILVRQAIDVGVVGVARTTSTAPRMPPPSIAHGTLPCTGLFLPTFLLGTALVMVLFQSACAPVERILYLECVHSVQPTLTPRQPLSSAVRPTTTLPPAAPCAHLVRPIRGVWQGRGGVRQMQGIMIWGVI
jgi:hypothetical protein